MLDRADQRRKDWNWTVPPNDNGKFSFEGAQLAVLMDIRDELKRINSKLDCYRVGRALDDLHSLGVATRRKPRKRKR